MGRTTAAAVVLRPVPGPRTPEHPVPDRRTTERPHDPSSANGGVRPTPSHDRAAGPSMLDPFRASFVTGLGDAALGMPFTGEADGGGGSMRRPTVDRRSSAGAVQSVATSARFDGVQSIASPMEGVQPGMDVLEKSPQTLQWKQCLESRSPSTPLRHPLMKGMKVQTGCCSMDRCLGRTGCEFAFKGLRSSGFDHRLPWRIAAVFRYIPSVGQEQDRRWVQKRNGHAIKTEHR